MDSVPSQNRVLVIGAIIGAILGAGIAYLLMVAPSDEEKEVVEIRSKDLLALTNTAASLVRKADDLRRKL